MPILNTIQYSEKEVLKQYDSFSDEYKQQVFMIWYDRGKPSASILWQYIGVDEYTGDRANTKLLNQWIKEDFSIKAAMLDKQVVEQMDQTMVQDKVVMLKRHAETAQKMQEKAWEYLEEHGIGNARNALTMLIRGIEIERDSRSLPKFLKEMEKMTDEELIEEVRKLSQGDGVIDLEASDPIE